jgi:hypothetical protein
MDRIGFGCLASWPAHASCAAGSAFGGFANLALTGLCRLGEFGAGRGNRLLACRFLWRYLLAHSAYSNHCFTFTVL